MAKNKPGAKAPSKAVPVDPSEQAKSIDAALLAKLGLTADQQAKDVAMDVALDALVDVPESSAASTPSPQSPAATAVKQPRAPREDEYALPVLSEKEKASYGNFWQRYRSTSSLSLASDGGRDTPSPATPSPATPTPSPATVLATLTAAQLVRQGATQEVQATVPATAEELAAAGLPAALPAPGVTSSPAVPTPT
ncbi:unnamed protein product, partial [Symbiodinium microadriaticum]